MPRRSRVTPHTLRKRTESPSPARARPHREPQTGAILTPTAPDSTEDAAVPAIPTPSAPAPYIRRQPRATAAAPVGTGRPTSPVRAERLTVTDYGYVVSELKRIGLTGGVVVLLLLVVSRFLR